MHSGGHRLTPGGSFAIAGDAKQLKDPQTRKTSLSLVSRLASIASPVHHGARPDPLPCVHLARYGSRLVHCLPLTNICPPSLCRVKSSRSMPWCRLDESRLQRLHTSRSVRQVPQPLGIPTFVRVDVIRNRRCAACPVATVRCTAVVHLYPTGTDSGSSTPALPPPVPAHISGGQTHFPLLLCPGC